MLAEAVSRRVLVAAVITGVHALVLYVAFTFAPQIKQLVAAAPVVVNFIAQQERPPAPPPPEIVPDMRTPQLQVAVMPQLEVAIQTPPSERAISVAVSPAPPPPPAPAAAPQVDRSIPKLITAVEYVREPAPRYPPQSRRLREQGLVVLKVLIDEHGMASRIEVETSSGHARLDDAAREAVARAAFRPYIEDGAPRRALVLIPIEFALNRGTA